MKIRKSWVIAVIISCAALILLNWPIYNTLTLRHVDDGQIFYSTNLQDHEPFYIRYIHSIHLTPVIETYYIDDQLNIVVDSVTYESYGVGMPSELEPGQTFTQKDGKFIVGNINRRLPFFDQRIGQVIANHILLVGKREVPLGELAKPGSAVRFQAVKESTAQRYGKGVLQWLKKLK